MSILPSVTILDSIRPVTFTTRLHVEVQGLGKDDEFASPLVICEGGSDISFARLCG